MRTRSRQIQERMLRLLGGYVSGEPRRCVMEQDDRVTEFACESLRRAAAHEGHRAMQILDQALRTEEPTRLIDGAAGARETASLYHVLMGITGEGRWAELAGRWLKVAVAAEATLMRQKALWEAQERARIERVTRSHNRAWQRMEEESKPIAPTPMDELRTVLDGARGYAPA